MKKKLLIGIFLFLICFTNVTAENIPYFYETDEGKYALCGSQPGCIEVDKNTDDLSYYSKTKEIRYNGYVYSFNSDAQQEYYETKYGITRMFFYMNTSGDYVLCDDTKNCKTYTREKLENMGADISNNNTITLNNGNGPGLPGDIYYYNSTIQSQVNNGEEVEIENLDGEKTGYCTSLKAPLQFIGNIVLIFKIIIPIIIIIFGAIDFFRAIIGAKDDEIKKSARSFVFRIISGVIIFFLPTIVSVLFSLISDFANIKGDFNACQKCVFNVTNCK